MEFVVTVPNLINTICIAAGIGICGLNLLQISFSKQIRADVRRYFQVFFALLLTYITTHLARQLMDGMPGAGICVALYAVTFCELLVAGLMAAMMSLLVTRYAFEGNPNQRIERVLLGLVGLHVLLLVADLFGHFVFYFDANNVYARGPLYILSNLCPLSMLIINTLLLIRHKDS